MANEHTQFELQDGIAVLRLNRPDARNALSNQMRDELRTAIERVRDDEAVKAFVLTGNGGAFCAGGDLQSMQGKELGGVVGRKRVGSAHPWLFELVDLEKPVIAAVDGPAFGAGCNIALCADFILASPRASFCEVFGRVGLAPDLGGFFLLPRIVGLQKAKELIFSARVVGAEEAKELGIVYRIVPEEGLMDAAMELAGRFRHASTDAIGLAKRVLNRSFNLDYHALSELEAYAQGTLFGTAYHKEAVRRFTSKEQLSFNWEALEKQAEKGR